MEDLPRQNPETQSNQKPLDTLEATVSRRIAIARHYEPNNSERIKIKKGAANELAITAILMNRLRKDMGGRAAITRTPIDMPKHQRREFAEIAKLAAEHEININDLDEVARMHKIHSELGENTNSLDSEN